MAKPRKPVQGMNPFAPNTLGGGFMGGMPQPRQPVGRPPMGGQPQPAPQAPPPPPAQQGQMGPQMPPPPQVQGPAGLPPVGPEQLTETDATYGGANTGGLDEMLAQLQAMLGAK